MNTKELIKKHERAIELLNAINEFDRRIKLNNEFKSGFIGSFPYLLNKLNHRIEIQIMAKAKIWQMYYKVMADEN